MHCGLSVWFHPTGSSLTLEQMVGVGLGSIALVMALAFLSFLAVWYVRLLSLRNKWYRGEDEVGVTEQLGMRKVREGGRADCLGSAERSAGNRPGWPCSSG